MQGLTYDESIARRCRIERETSRTRQRLKDVASDAAILIGVGRGIDSQEIVKAVGTAFTDERPSIRAAAREVLAAIAPDKQLVQIAQQKIAQIGGRTISTAQSNPLERPCILPPCESQSNPCAFGIGDQHAAAIKLTL